jgi:hypothetical protein
MKLRRALDPQLSRRERIQSLLYGYQWPMIYYFYTKRTAKSNWLTATVFYLVSEDRFGDIHRLILSLERRAKASWRSQRIGCFKALLVNTLQNRLFKAWVTWLDVSPRYNLRGKLLSLDYLLNPHDNLGITEETGLQKLAKSFGNVGNEMLHTMVTRYGIEGDCRWSSKALRCI